MSKINIKAITIGMFFGYILPIGIIWLLSQITFQLNSMVISSTVGIAKLLWFFLFAPLTTGYLAAKYSSVQPLLQGLLAISIPMLWVIYNVGFNPIWLLPVFVILSIVLAIFGARRFKFEAKI